MKYFSTRNTAVQVTAAEAILKGLSEEGGLFVPEVFPQLEYENLAGLSYEEMAWEVFTRYFTDFDPERIRNLIGKAYGSFDAAQRVVVKRVGSQSVMELFHGPTLAFKDMALSVLPHLMVEAKRMLGSNEETVILTATSGDTGKAALEGFSEVEGTQIIVFYPKDGVSEVQELQMVTQTGENTHVVAIEGNFDDAQRAVKSAFQSQDLQGALAAMGSAFSSANSINIGRLVPQIVYYFYGYHEMVRQGHLRMGETLSVCVPTGNFGNILAAYYAREMGLPIGKLLCASNDNHILTDFIRTGQYDTHRPFIKTISPSMDILVSSNLERFVFEMINRDESMMNQLMKDLKETGVFALSEEAASRVRDLMQGDYASQQQTLETINACRTETGYLLDPHTAVAYHVANAEENVLIASTASPYKFGESILSALGRSARGMGVADVNQAISELTGTGVPAGVDGIETREVRHHRTCRVDEIDATILDILKAGGQV